MFAWKEFPNLANDEIQLVIKNRDEPDLHKGYAPVYRFTILHIRDDRDIGVVCLSVDHSRRQYLVGHLSYGVDPAYKGHYFAAKACMLIKEVALQHGLRRLFVGAGHDNVASRKTILKLGARPVTIADVPDEDVLEELKKNRCEMFVWEIAP